MAGDWIPFEIVTPDKPEILAIAGKLETDPDAVVGKLLRVWSWFNQHTEDGNAPVTVKMLLDRITGVSGFCAAMKESGWLIDNGETLTLPHFERFNSKGAKTRLRTAQRVAEHRERKRNNNKDGNTASVTKSVTREEKSKEDHIPPKVPQGTKGTVRLDELHCRIIRCITPNSKCDRARDTAEMRRWKKVKAAITEEDVASVEAFYAVAKSKQCDQTWNRKTGVTQLLNQWTEQVELAQVWAEADKPSDFESQSEINQGVKLSRISYDTTDHVDPKLEAQIEEALRREHGNVA